MKDAFTLWLAGNTEEAMKLANDENEKICEMGASKYYNEQKRKNHAKKKDKRMILPPKN